MASSSNFARVGLISVVTVILGINTLSSLLPASDFKAPSISGPPLPIRPERDVARSPVTDVQPRHAKVTSTAVALLALPQQWPVADSGTTGLAPLPQPTHPGLAAAGDASEAPAPPPGVVEAGFPPKPAKRAAGPRRPKTISAAPRLPQHGGTPIYTRDVQMSVY
jgi:hypothetical protein